MRSHCSAICSVSMVWSARLTNDVSDRSRSWDRFDRCAGVGLQCVWAFANQPKQVVLVNVMTQVGR
jgi:hypothetical protein